MGTTAAGRAGLQLVESSFIVGSLVVVLEWVVPLLQRRPVDMQEMGVLCVFSFLAVVLHVLVAYLRPASKAELAQQIEEILYEDVRRPALPPTPRTDFLQLKQWAMNDRTWDVTVPGMPVMPPRRH